MPGILVFLCFFWTCNAKVIGFVYLVFGVVFGVSGFMYSWLMRSELGGIGEQVLLGDTQFYNVLITSHAMLMIFFFVMPATVSGFGNLLLPILASVPEMVFPKINNVGLWLLPLGFLLLVGSGVFDEGCGTAWTIYPPLSLTGSHGGLSVDCFIIALHSVGLSSLSGAINVLSTVGYAKRACFTIQTASLYTWSLVCTAALLIAVVPVLAGGITMLLTDRSMNTVFFDCASGGDLIFFQHLFWVFGHPEVYIIILPVFGLVSHVLQHSGNFCLFNVLGMVYAMVSISIVGFFVWAHHMFTVGLDVDARTYFSSITLLIALPTSIKVFSWLVCLLRVWVADSVFFVGLGFLSMFVVGGVSGLSLGNSELATAVHDTYFVVGHFHYVLSLGAVFGVLVGVLVLLFFFVGGTPTDSMLRFSVVVLVIGTNTVFWPMHRIGLLGFPRRIPDMLDVFFFSGSLISTGLLVVLVGLVFLAVLSVAAPSITTGMQSPYTTALVIATLSTVYSSGDLLMSTYSITHTYASVNGLSAATLTV